MKDLFSEESGNYAQYRPTYPQVLFTWLVTQLKTTDRAWDCATGSGQVATLISPYFKQVYATDISQQQLNQAPRFSNVIYQVGTAENSLLPDAAFDLVVVAQAVHWFQFDAFYTEVKRVLKPAGLIALIGYGLMQVDKETDAVIQNLYSYELKGYWDIERRYIDEQYQTIPFPFIEIAAPPFAMIAEWTLPQLLGYLQTWSAVKHYTKATGNNPILAVKEQLEPIWKKATKNIQFPQLLRVGKQSY